VILALEMLYIERYDYLIKKKEETLSKKSKRKSGNKTVVIAETISLVTAILNLVIAILVIIEKLTN
jgi:hypothetical protein